MLQLVVTKGFLPGRHVPQVWNADFIFCFRTWLWSIQHLDVFYPFTCYSTTFFPFCPWYILSLRYFFQRASFRDSDPGSRSRHYPPPHPDYYMQNQATSAVIWNSLSPQREGRWCSSFWGLFHRDKIYLSFVEAVLDCVR